MIANSKTLGGKEEEKERKTPTTEYCGSFGITQSYKYTRKQKTFMCRRLRAQLAFVFYPSAVQQISLVSSSYFLRAINNESYPAGVPVLRETIFVPGSLLD